MSYFAITSNHPRHIKFLQTLQEHVKLSTTIIVPKEGHYPGEESFFSNCLTVPNKIYLKCNEYNLESDLVVGGLVKSKPKVGFIFGAPLISSKIYSIPEYGCVNIHTGLVQHYRGVDSTSWAIHDNRLDCIGVTLHYIDDSIDGGDIIDQDKIKVELEDDPNTIFFKVCQAGFGLVSKNISNIIKNKSLKTPLGERGKLYQTKDMTSKVVEDINRNYKKRIKEFLNENNS